MPPFPERESSILAKLKKKRPEKTQNETMIPREAKPLPKEFQENAIPGPKAGKNVKNVFFILDNQTILKYFSQYPFIHQ